MFAPLQIAVSSKAYPEKKVIVWQALPCPL
jgi:hypothetical protein